MERKKAPIWMLLLLFSVSFLFLPLIAEAKENKFLIFHLDAVSSVDFYAQLEAGNLPNIEALFADGRFVKYGLSLFPGGTEMIYPRLKKGLTNSEGSIVGWTRWDRETKKSIHNLETFSEMFSNFSRRNKHQFLLGLP